MCDAYSFWARVFTALGAVNTHHASLPWRYFMDSHGYPPSSLPRAYPFVDYIVLFSYLCCFYGDWYSDVIDDRYLEKLINLFEEHPAIYNTLLKEYKDSIRIGSIWDSITEARNVETWIFR